jgi:uncharacterized YigZ family protein
MSYSGIYSTISKPSQGIYKEKGSKFLSFAFPVSATEQTNEILSRLKKEHHSAKHHCYAYRIKTQATDLVRANDDGEPANTAGKPILGQIDSFYLTNVIIVVVRYFGGTLLGKGGLVQAYKLASADAINNAKIIQVEPEDIFKITADYKNINDILKIIGSDGSEIIASDYSDNIVVKIRIPASKSAGIVSKFKRFEGVKVEAITRNLPESMQVKTKI